MLTTDKKTNKAPLNESTLGGQQVLDYTCVTVAYELTKGVWRGFVMPYNITYEADSREKVVSVLREMIDLYEEGVREYKHPAHLINVPFSDLNDIEKHKEIGADLMNNLLAKNATIVRSNYYAEAKVKLSA